ncbi:MAG: rod-binding protein [Paracoccaceae bacterium]|nr:rod-binding protein [Paracoccaceae bacterium]
MAAPISPLSAPAARPAGRGDAALRAAAEELESAFLAEMLKSAGVGRPRESFGGGAGEEQFSSFLRQAQAGAMVKAGGIGLAEVLFEALKERADVEK